MQATDRGHDCHMCILSSDGMLQRATSTSITCAEEEVSPTVHGALEGWAGVPSTGATNVSNDSASLLALVPPGTPAPDVLLIEMHGTSTASGGLTALLRDIRTSKWAGGRIHVIACMGADADYDTIMVERAMQLGVTRCIMGPQQAQIQHWDMELRAQERRVWLHAG